MIVQVEKCTVYQYCLKEPYYLKGTKILSLQNCYTKFCPKHGAYCGIAIYSLHFVRSLIAEYPGRNAKPQADGIATRAKYIEHIKTRLQQHETLDLA